MSVAVLDVKKVLLPTTAMTTTHISSPIKGGHSSLHKVSDATAWLKSSNAVTKVTYEVFKEKYLSDALDPEPQWADGLQSLVREVRSVAKGNEKELYTGSKPLLSLLNTVNDSICNSLGITDQAFEFFHYSKHLVQPFYGTDLKPDILILPKRREPSPSPTPSDQPSERTTTWHWSNIVAIGEVKVTKDADCQTANYLRNHLRARPDLNSVLGFSTKGQKGYSLFYHDASVIHRTAYVDWSDLDPLHAFIQQLYKGMPYDPSMAILQPMDSIPTWAININHRVFVTISLEADPGLGQRRFTARLQSVDTEECYFLKDFYRDDLRRFCEALLYEQAHKGMVIPGLMQAEYYGHPVGVDGELMKTSKYGKGLGVLDPPERTKFRVVTRDVGQQLSEIKSLKELLSVMYDACVVQRNLYRKCKILHRDISENNIMIAPKDDGFYKRCEGGYDEVKYLNQVLYSTQNFILDPQPACLVIDLGLGADLKDKRSEVRAARTGTPKFISRSVSSGELLGMVPSSDKVTMPELSEDILRLHPGCLGHNQYNRTPEPPPSDDPEKVEQTPKPSSEEVEIPVSHQLFHDAESTFWVIAWLLARLAPKASEPETHPTVKLKSFLKAMETQVPGGEEVDPRIGLSQNLQNWQAIVHPGLADVARMLSDMHKYIIPEWGYRPELDPEHVHEALMRLLLREIVRIGKTDIELTARSPALFAAIKTEPKSKSKSESTSRSMIQTTASSLAPPAPSNPNKRSLSLEQGEATRRVSPRLRELELRSAAETNQTKSLSIMDQAKLCQWPAGAGELKESNIPETKEST